MEVGFTLDGRPVEVEVGDEDGPPVSGSDAVLATMAAAAWIHGGLPVEWPTRWGGRG